jgi:hypothetical protein
VIEHSERMRCVALMSGSGCCRGLGATFEAGLVAASVILAPNGGIPCSCSVQTYAALHFMWGLNINSDDQGAPDSRASQA